MSVKSYFKEVKRKFFRGLTSLLIGGTSSDINEAIDPNSVKRVLLVRTNHRLGNLLLITPVLQKIEHIFPNATIDLVVQGGVAPVLFQNYQSVDKYISLPKKGLKFPFTYAKLLFSIRQHRYDIAMNIVSGSSSGRICTLFAKARYKLLGENEDKQRLEAFTDYRHLAKMPVYRLHIFCDKAKIATTSASVPTMNLKLSDSEIANGAKILRSISKTEKPVICIFTFATGTKLYPKSWWKEYYNKLIEAFPSYTIIEMLPVENVSQIDFAAPSFYSKDLREMAAIIENTKVFISVDGGVMHLATTTRTATIGLFKSDIISKYAPYGGHNMAIDTSKQSIDYIITEMRKRLNS